MVGPGHQTEVSLNLDPTVPQIRNHLATVVSLGVAVATTFTVYATGLLQKLNYEACAIYFHLATPPGFQVTNIPKGNLVLYQVYDMVRMINSR